MLRMAKLMNDELDKQNPLKLKVVPQTKGWTKTSWKDLQKKISPLPYHKFTREALEKWNHGISLS